MCILFLLQVQYTVISSLLCKIILKFHFHWLFDRHGANQGRNDQSILGPAPPAHQGGGGGGYGGGYNQRQGGYGQGRNE